MRTPAGSIPAAGLAAAPRTTKTVQRRERPQRGLHIMLAGLSLVDLELWAGRADPPAVHASNGRQRRRRARRYG
jgi:hypothetical protein